MLEENFKWTRDCNKILENKTGDGNVLTDETVRGELPPTGHQGDNLLKRSPGRLWAQSQQVSQSGEDDTGQQIGRAHV